MTAARIPSLLAGALVATLTASCGASAPARFYTLDSEATSDGLPAASYGVAIGMVSVPAAVDRPQLVVQVAPNRVEIDEFNRWAAPLADSIAGAVAADLSVLLGTPNVATAPRGNFDPSYRVTIDVQRFDSVPGEGVTVEAVWAVTRIVGGDMRSGRTIAHETVATEGLRRARRRAQPRADSAEQRHRGCDTRVGQSAALSPLRGIEFFARIDSVIIELVRKVSEVAARLEVALARRQDARLARQLATQSDFSFVMDFVSTVTPAWDQHLAAFVGRPHVALLEIGSYEGRSMVWFLQHVLTHPTSRMTCVDPFDPLSGEPRFDHNLRVGGWGDRVRKIKGRSEAALVTLDTEAFDIVYIDGSHEAVNVLMDAVASWRLLKPGGVMIFDDYLWELTRPADRRPQIAIDMFLRDFRSRLEVLHHEYQVIVRKLAVE